MYNYAMSSEKKFVLPIASSSPPFPPQLHVKDTVAIHNYVYVCACRSGELNGEFQWYVQLLRHHNGQFAYDISL